MILTYRLKKDVLVPMNKRLIRLKKRTIYYLDEKHNILSKCIKLCQRIEFDYNDRYYIGELRVYSDFDKYFEEVE